MTYDLRRLREHRIIEWIPRSFRYRLTAYGLEVATAYTLAHDRVLRPGVTHLADPALPFEVRRAYTISSPTGPAWPHDSDSHNVTREQS